MSLSSPLQTILLLATIILAYIWLSTPFLANYSLQIFALSTILYFLLKRYQKAKIWHIAPSQMSFEIALASFSFLMLIGASGNRDSIFYPLIYVHLFFLVFSTTPITSIIITVGLMWFHYALGIEINVQEVADLLTLPLIMSFFLFTKNQYQEVIRKSFLLDQENKIINKESQEVIGFIDHILQPKLTELKDNLLKTDKFAAQDVEQINQEVEKLESHIQAYVGQISKQNEKVETA